MATPESRDAVINTKDRADVYRSATFALACFILFFLTVVVSQILRPDLNPVRDFLSAYALSDYGFVMTVGFVAIGIGILMLGVSLWSNGIVNQLGRVGTIFLGIAGAAMMGIALFPAEIDVVDPSPISQLHDLSALIHFFAITVGALFVSLNFRTHPLWRRYSRSETLLAVATAMAFLLYITIYLLQAGDVPAVPRLRPTIGAFQRLLIFFDWLWLLVTALRMRELMGPRKSLLS